MLDRIVLAFASMCLCVASTFWPDYAQAENKKYGLGTLSSTSSIKLIRPGGDDGRSSLFRKPGTLASLRRSSTPHIAPVRPSSGASSSDFNWFWTEAMPTAASDRDGLAPGLVRYIDDRRARGLPVWGNARAGNGIYKRFREAIDKAAHETGLSWAVITSVITIESAGVATATSPKGAMGLMQLMPATAARFGVEKAYDPFENISGGARYFAELLKLHNGDFVLALASYNAGEGAVDKYQGVPPYNETRDYVAKFFSIYAATKTFCADEQVDPAVSCEWRA